MHNQFMNSILKIVYISESTKTDANEYQWNNAWLQFSKFLTTQKK